MTTPPNLSIPVDDINIVVDKAVRRTLITLGIDISTADKMLAAQADFGYLRKQRVGSEEVAKWAKRSLVGAFFSGLVYLVINGIKAALTVKGVVP